MSKASKFRIPVQSNLKCCREIYWTIKWLIMLKMLPNNTHTFSVTGKNQLTSFARPLPFDPQEWPASNFSSHYHSWITHSSHEIKGNDQQLKKLVIFKRTFLFSTSRNVRRAMWTKYILMLGCNRLKVKSTHQIYLDLVSVVKYVSNQLFIYLLLICAGTRKIPEVGHEKSERCC